MSRLTRQQIAEAIVRVRTDGARPLSQLADLSGITARTLERYIVSGVEGVHLDGIKDPRHGLWKSSEAALRRFQDATRTLTERAKDRPREFSTS